MEKFDEYYTEALVKQVIDNINVIINSLEETDIVPWIREWQDNKIKIYVNLPYIYKVWLPKNIQVLSYWGNEFDNQNPIKLNNVGVFRPGLWIKYIEELAEVKSRRNINFEPIYDRDIFKF